MAIFLSNQPTMIELSSDATLRSLQGEAVPIEMAAIASAVVVYIRNQPVTTAATEKEQTWNGKCWQFAGRHEEITGRSFRVPLTGPTDEWTMTDRINSLE